MEPSGNSSNNSMKGGNMILNRFCIDEDGAFEISGVNYFKKTSERIIFTDEREFQLKRKDKGKE